MLITWDIFIGSFVTLDRGLHIFSKCSNLGCSSLFPRMVPICEGVLLKVITLSFCFASPLWSGLKAISYTCWSSGLTSTWKHPWSKLRLSKLFADVHSWRRTCQCSKGGAESRCLPSKEHIFPLALCTHNSAAAPGRLLDELALHCGQLITTAVLLHLPPMFSLVSTFLHSGVAMRWENSCFAESQAHLLLWQQQEALMVAVTK